jgi:hypothetical protein
MRRPFLHALSGLLVFAAVSLSGQSVDPEFVRDAIGLKSYPSAPHLAQQAKIAPAATLPAATVAVPEELDAIRVWNDANRLPFRNGFARRIADPLSVQLGGGIAAAKEGVAAHARGVMAASARGIVWSGILRVEGAHRVRVRLSNVKVPAGTVFWAYGSAEEPVAFGPELIDPNGDLWTPSVAGDLVHLEVETNGPASFEIREVMEIVAAEKATRLKPVANDEPACLLDVNCINNSTAGGLDTMRRAIAQLTFVKDGGNYVCSGGLLNDSDTATSVPYLLTANHCFSTQSSASSLEATWDFRYNNCETSAISAGTRTVGSTLLATSANSDFTFVRMTSVPSGRVLLGWNANTAAIPNGTSLYRISHPAPEGYGPQPQLYSRTVVNTSFGTCSARPRDRYIYTTGGEGGVYGGSSGSPVFITGGQVVGQLFGSCGPDPEAGCDPRNATVDGAFSATYGSISQYLSGGSPIQPEPCVPSATQVCLNSNRFAVKVAWRTRDGQSGSGQAIKYTADSALFWFFSSTNIEMLVKVLDGCGVNNRYWVFGAASTDVEYTLTVTDSRNGAVRTYVNPQGTLAAAIAQTGAFACQ